MSQNKKTIELSIVIPGILDFNISAKEIMKEITGEQILLYYFGKFELNKKYKSPFREERTPSFIINYYKGRLVWRDLGIRPAGFNPIDLVMRLKNLSYHDACKLVWKDLVVKGGRNKDLVEHSKRIAQERKLNSEFNTENSVVSHVKFRKFYTPGELEYWNQYYISQEELLKYRIYPGQLYYYNKLFHSSTNEDPLFIYMFNQERLSWKAYRPLCKEKQNKFRNNNCSTVIQGFEFLPMIGDNLIYTSSYKDVITLTKAGFNAIAPQSENVFIDKWVYRDLKDRFTNHFTLFDNDQTGIKRSQEIRQEYGTRILILPELKSCKDPSDFSKKLGLSSLHKLVDNMINPKDNLPF